MRPFTLYAVKLTLRFGQFGGQGITLILGLVAIGNQCIAERGLGATFYLGSCCDQIIRQLELLPDLVAVICLCFGQFGTQTLGLACTGDHRAQVFDLAGLSMPCIHETCPPTPLIRVERSLKPVSGFV